MYPFVVYHGFVDMPGRSGIRGGTNGCEFELPGRLQQSNTKYDKSSFLHTQTLGTTLFLSTATELETQSRQIILKPPYHLLLLANPNP